jgi:hypothetical protein
LKKTLYGLKQALITWYSRLEKYLQQQSFKRGTTNGNLYIKIENEKMLTIVVYVDDIIFGSNVDRMNQKISRRNAKRI